MEDVAEALLGVGFFVAFAVTVRSVAAVWMKRLEAGRDDTVERRLERIEAAVDLIGVEVERMAEAQRFTASLAGGRQPGDPPSPATGSGSPPVTPN